MNKRSILIVIGSLLVIASAIGAFFIANNEQENTKRATESLQSTDSSATQNAPEAKSSITKLSATFASVGEKTGSGSVQLVTENGASHIELGSDFSVQDGPDLYIGFGNDNVIDTTTLVAPLKSTTGAQTYHVPDSINTADYTQIFIYCKEYATVFSVANLT